MFRNNPARWSFSNEGDLMRVRTRPLPGRAILGAAALAAALIAGCEHPGAHPGASRGESSAPTGMPRFEVDPFWPKALPENWILGQSAASQSTERPRLGVSAPDHPSTTRRGRR